MSPTTITTTTAIDTATEAERGPRADRRGDSRDLPALPTGASTGQVVVMFAIFMIGLLGMLGLATDVGYMLAGRRATQGAADAGAIAGARMIARYTTTSPTSALPEVEAALRDNQFGPSTFGMHLCQYIGPNWGVVGTCGQVVPASAAGVRVQAKTTFPTFFIRALPGAPKSVSVVAYAKARVERAVGFPRNAPMMVCASGAWDVTGVEATTDPASGASRSTFISPKIANSAIGRTFRVVDPDLGDHGNSDCGSEDDAFTGLTDQSANGGKSIGSAYRYADDDDSPGETIGEKDGPDGCEDGTSAPYDCVMILPIARPGEIGSSEELTVVAFAAFRVSAIDDDRINATLLDDYIVSGDGTNTWCSTCGGVVVIRLIW